MNFTKIFEMFVFERVFNSLILLIKIIIGNLKKKWQKIGVYVESL